MMNLEMKIEMFAKVLESDQVKAAGTCIPNIKNCKVIITPGRKYIKVDVAGCGRYMVDQEGNIFGIKGYGKINKNHYYGTLETINNYYWGRYTGVKLQTIRDLNSEHLTTVEETVNILETAEQEKQKIKNELLESEINFESTPEDDELLNVEIVEETQENFTTEEIAETNKIIDSIKEMGWILKEVFINNDDMCIYGKVINSKGVEVIEGLYAPSYNKHELKGVLRCLQSKITDNIEEVQEEPQQENNNIIDLSSFRNKKVAKQEIKQPTKDNKIKICVCGSILKGEEIQLGICRNCIEYVYSAYLDGTLKERDENLYNMIHEAMEK